MAITAILTLPPAGPDITTPPTAWATAAQAMVDWMTAVAPEFNAAISGINATLTGIASSEADVLASRNAAMAGANFSGDWGDLTGALSVPASVRHGGVYWLLIVDLADVTTVEPGTDPATWARLGPVGKKTLWIPARDFIPCTTDGPDTALYESTTNHAMRSVLLFDQATTERAQAAIRMPESWDAGEVTISPVWENSARIFRHDYTGMYASGPRTAVITVSAVAVVNGSGGGSVASAQKLVDGVTAGEGVYFTHPTHSGQYIQFTFPSAVYIDQVRVTSVVADNVSMGTYSWQGSNNGSDWDDVTTGIDLYQGNGVAAYDVSGGTPYKYFRMFCEVAGASTRTAQWLSEFEFRLTTEEAATVGSVAWGIRGMAIGDHDQMDAPFGCAQVVVDYTPTAGSSPALLLAAESNAITLNGTPAKGDYVILEVFRDVANTADVLDADAKLLGVNLHYTTDNDTDD